MKTVVKGLTLAIGLAAIGASTQSLADRVSTNTYYPNGLVHTIDGPRTNVSDVTTLEYTTSGYLSKATNAVGHITLYQNHNARGLPEKIIDPNGVVTLLDYNGRGWLETLSVQAAGGSLVTSFTYNANGDITQILQPGGALLNYEYDTANRLTAISNNLSERIEYTLNDAGDRTQTSIKNASSTIVSTHQQVFDELSRVINDQGANGQDTATTYDANGNPATSTDALSNQTQHAYDALDRLEKRTNALLDDEDYTYDADDRIKTVSDQRGFTTTYNYNTYDDLTSLISPDTGTTTYQYDNAGNMTQRTDARGVVTTYTYDAINRVTAVVYPAHTAENVTYTYDSTSGGNKGKGRLTSYSNDGGATTIKYDERGNITQTAFTIDSKTFTTSYTFDGNNNLSSMTYPGGRVLNYNRDATGKVTSMTTKSRPSDPLRDVATGVTHLSYGGLTDFTYGNGIAASLTYDNDYRVSSITSTGSSATLHNKAYTYDVANNITAITDGVDSGFNQSFLYDGVYRLTEDTGNYWTRVYVYDKNGNRTKRGSQWYFYESGSNRIDRAGSKEITLDAAGAMIDTQQGGNKVLAYNDAHRMVSFTKDGTLMAEYDYNAIGQRVKKERHFSGGNETYYYFYSPDGTALGNYKLKANGAWDYVDYIWLDGAPVAQMTQGYWASTYAKPEDAIWLHFDHLNTPRVGTNDSQTEVWRWDGDAFGQGGVDNNPDGDTTWVKMDLRFPGQVHDTESNLYYNYYRDYDPSLGRYIQADPIGVHNKGYSPERITAKDIGVDLPMAYQGLNMIYGYSTQNPLNKYDQTGEFWRFIPAIVIGGGLYIYNSCLEKCMDKESDEECSPSQKHGNCSQQCKPFIDLFTTPISRGDASIEGGKKAGEGIGELFRN